MIKILFYTIFPLILLVSLLVYFFANNKQKKKRETIKNSFFIQRKSSVLIDLKNKKFIFNFVNFEDNEEGEKLSFSFEEFLNTFTIIKRKEKFFYDLLKKSSKEEFLETDINRFFEAIFKKEFSLYSKKDFSFGENILLNLMIENCDQEEKIIYGSGNFLNFKDLNYLKIIKENPFKFLNHLKLSDQMYDYFKNLSLNNYFVISIFDKRALYNASSKYDSKKYILELFYIYLKNIYSHVFIDDHYNIYLLDNKKIYQDVYLANKYWKEKIDILYKQFLIEYKITNEYNDLITLTYNNVIDSKIILNNAWLYFRICKNEIIKVNTKLDYQELLKTTEKNYKYYTSFLYSSRSEIISQKELKYLNSNDKAYLLSFNFKDDFHFELLPLNWRIKIYKKFLEEVYKLSEENKEKNYKMIFPLVVYNYLDFSLLEKKINLKLYVSAFKNIYQYLEAREQLNTTTLPINRIGVYIDNITYGRELIYNLNPKYIWITRKIERKRISEFSVDKFFQDIFDYEEKKEFVINLEII